MLTGERRVDLDGAGVALECALHVVHLLQGVAHVGVGVGEGRLDPAQEGRMEGIISGGGRIDMNE